MSKKIHSGMLLALLLIGMVTLAFNIPPAKGEWTGTVYIRADGSIDPPDAPISTVDNVTYTLTGNITSDADGIVVERDHIVIDGAGYTIQGPGAYQSKGIDLTGRSNVTIKNCNMRNFWHGIYLRDSSNCTLSGNTITNNYFGIGLSGSSNNSVSGNNITNNNYGGIWLSGSSNYNTVSGNNITNNYYGIGLSGSSNNSVSGNNITNNHYGIWHYSSSNNSVSGNNITDNNYYGIWLDSSSNNSISGNTITNTVFGIWLSGLIGSSNNSVSGNNITNNHYGIWLSHSSNNSVSGNNITNNWYGIVLSYSSNNTVYHNNLIDNTQQVYFPSSGYSNVWDDGYPSGGNYWSDYIAKGGYDADGDGIGDIPYVIDENNQDNYPLMEPYSPLPRTIDELKAEIEELGSDGEIDNQGIVTSLLAKLDAAQKLIADEKVDQAKIILNAFINEVHAQSGKHIRPEAADILIESAEYILSHL